MKLKPLVGTAIFLFVAVTTFPGCGEKYRDVRDSQACQLLLQAFESAEGMSPGWYGRTATTLDSECEIFVPQKGGSV